ncbi:MAG: Crp/Fnr family transcriptional regulator [Acidobacteria bacterium]|nr:Crp/Fnr family transcriptional regulator [Acidobacteriota bacterium]MBI3421587.1 Crp/Fnr family transcriptional regulator [Acidobacteriota bacterium]
MKQPPKSATAKPFDRHGAPQHYPPGIALLRQGVAVRELYVLQHGLVKLVHTAASGRECLLGLRMAGAWLGTAAAVLHVPAPCSAFTLTDCAIYRLPVAAYPDWFKTDADFAWQRHAAVCRELTQQMQHTADLVCASARQRLEQVLWQMARELAAFGGGKAGKPASKPADKPRHTRLQLPLQQQELAALIAVTPAHLSRLFKELEHAGLLRRDNGWVVLPAPDRLWHAR